jgi:cell wall-associated NlpC family hydrolase
MIDYNKYLSQKHQYGIFDCITLVQQFYSTELGIAIALPEYPHNRQWMKQFSYVVINDWAAKYAKKVSLTAAKNYDLIVFKSEKSDLVIHFGLYIAPNRMLHVEEGNTARIDYLSDYWVNKIYAVYHYDRMV